MSGAALLASAVIAASTASGLEIRQVRVTRSAPDEKGAARETPERMTVFFAGDMARLERGEGENKEITIVRLREKDRGEMIEIDDALRNYKRRTFKQLREQWRSANELLLEDIEARPAAHRNRGDLIDQLTDGPQKWKLIWESPRVEWRKKLIEKYNLPDEPPKIEVRKTKETKEIAGVECKRYEALENGKVTDWAYLAEGEEFDRRYYDFMELSGWLGPELVKGLKEAKGLPLESIMHVRTGGSVELRTESVTARDFKESTFEIPEGYVEQKKKGSFR